MTKPAARPLAEIRAALIACRDEHSKWPTRESGIVLRRAEKAYADAAQTPAEIREVLTSLRGSQAIKATKTRTTLIGGLYERLATAVEAAIVVEQEEAAKRVALRAECEARIEAARAAAPAMTKLASGMEVETRLILSITGKPGDQWAQVSGLSGKHPIHDADATPVRKMFLDQMDAVMSCRTPAQQAEIDATLDALDAATYEAAHKPWSSDAAAKLDAAQAAFSTAYNGPTAEQREIAEADAEAERIDMQAKADRLKQLTAACPATEDASLDDLLGMIREAAERGDWTQVHEYALDIASIADGNINGGA